MKSSNELAEIFLLLLRIKRPTIVHHASRVSVIVSVCTEARLLLLRGARSVMDWFYMNDLSGKLIN